MPIVNCDVKSLEIVVAAELANDSVMKKEILDKEDLHENNRVRFGLPSRLIAKIFNFRLIYGGTAYSYANDPDFMGVSTSVKFWEKVIIEYYNKYKGLAQWHTQLVKDVVKQGGWYYIPSGRGFKFDPSYSKQEPWPITKIKNYPVQGFGADLVMLARIEAWRRINEEGLESKFIQTIHDSLVYDCPTEEVPVVAKILTESVAKVPELCYNYWDYKFSLPLSSEILVGPNKYDLKEYTHASHA